MDPLCEHLVQWLCFKCTKPIRALKWVHLLGCEQRSFSLALVLSLATTLLLSLVNFVYTALLFSISCNNLPSPAAGQAWESVVEL